MQRIDMFWLVCGSDSHYKALFGKVGHDDLESLIRFSKQGIHGNLDIVQRDHRGSTSFLSAVRYSSLREAGTRRWDNEHGYPTHSRTSCSHSGCHVGCPRCSCDPLLRAVDNIEFAILRLSCSCLNSANVASSRWLSNS